MTAAILTIAPALQRFSILFILNHAADNKPYNHQKNPAYNNSPHNKTSILTHNKPFIRETACIYFSADRFSKIQATIYLAIALLLTLNLRVPLSLYGLTRR